MNKEKLINFMRDNKHKFVFFSYKGGMGGETICNYLTQETDYFYNKNFGSSDYTEVGAENSNRSLFTDWLFGDFFMNESLMSSYNSVDNDCHNGSKLTEHDTIHTWEDWYDKFCEITSSSSGHFHPSVLDDSMDEVIDKFTRQDKPYLIRQHSITPLMKLFEGTIIIDIAPNEWEKYCTTLSEAKVFCSPLITYDEKTEAISELCRYYEEGLEVWIDNDALSPDATVHTSEEAATLKKFLLDYVGDELLNDTSWTLYFKTLDVLVNIDKYQLDLDSFKNVVELNTFVHALHMWRSFPMMLTQRMRREVLSWDARKDYGTKIDEVNHHNPWWPIMYKYEREWYDKINPQLYNMNDLFSGTFIKEQFGLDVKPYVKMYEEWHNKNCKFLKSQHMTNYLP